MSNWTILYDEPQEAAWFRNLNPEFETAHEASISGFDPNDGVRLVLAYDRPDVILLHNGQPVLVVEETVEVPSGHNVGQRFARLAAAAEAGVPCLYFGPYVAQKHGGNTAGPRFMNLRLFHALDILVRATSSAVTTINWPVDSDNEVRRDPLKDADVRDYVAMFLTEFKLWGLPKVNGAILASKVHDRMLQARRKFIEDSVKKAEQYDAPPPSVEFLDNGPFATRAGREMPPEFESIVLYQVGMNNIRSDPYTGMAMLYKYLYATEQPTGLVLWFPNITKNMWALASTNALRKDIRLYRLVADGILFKDGLAHSYEL